VICITLAPTTALASAGRGRLPESLHDAWWTGSLLASSAATVPPGYVYVEPYVYDGMAYGYFDETGQLHGVPQEQDVRSLIDLEYGLSTRLSVGMVLHFGYDLAGRTASSSRIGTGDTVLKAQYQFSDFSPGSWLPIFAVNIQETLPTGHYDRLARQSNGFGAGVYSTMISALLQTYTWMPNGRIVRWRLNLSYSVPSWASIAGRSVYGTPLEFRGTATSGASEHIDAALEYSVTRHWVLALDLWFERDAGARVDGALRLPGRTQTLRESRHSGHELITAPALEYNFSARVGVIVGVRLVATARNEAGSVTPMAAFSYLD
jgi:hypothetical protein